LARAGVDARAEAELRARVAADIEDVGVLEDARVAVGRAEQQHHLRPRRDRVAGEQALAVGGAVERMYRLREADRLLEGVACERGVLAEQAPLVGIGREV